MESIGHDASDTIASIFIENDSDGWAQIANDGKSFRLVFDPDTSDADGDGVMGFTVYFETAAAIPTSSTTTALTSACAMHCARRGDRERRGRQRR